MSSQSEAQGTTDPSLRSILSSLVALMGSSFFVHLANSAITTMIALVVASNGGAQSDVAFIAASYSTGFIFGCFLTPRHIARIGLIRGFAAAAAVLTISIVALDIYYEVTLWSFLRFSMGASMAAILAISDAWLNNKAPGAMRGRIIAANATLLGGASLLGQMVFLFTADTGVEDFVLMFAITTNIAVVFVAIASRDAPVLEERPKRPLFSMTFTSPVATVGAFSSGFMITAMVSILPFYQTKHGVSENLVAITLIMLHLGRLLFMWPVGQLSDRMDRRMLLMVLSGVAIALLLVGVAVGEGEGRAVGGEQGLVIQIVALAVFVLLGASLYPMYSVASGLAFDRAEGRPMIDVSTTILAVNSLGAIAGPFAIPLIGAVVGDDLALPTGLLLACALNLVVAAMSRRVPIPASDQTPTVSTISPTSVEMVQVAAEVVEEEVAQSSDETGQSTERGSVQGAADLSDEDR